MSHLLVFTEECRYDGILQVVIARAEGAVCWSDLSGAVGAEYREVGEALTDTIQIMVFTTIKIGATTDAGEHQGTDRIVVAFSETLNALLHVRFCGGWLPDGPGQILSRFNAFSECQRVVRVGAEDGNRAIAALDQRIFANGFAVHQDGGQAVQALRRGFVVRAERWRNAVLQTVLRALAADAVYIKANAVLNPLGLAEQL